MMWKTPKSSANIEVKMEGGKEGRVILSQRTENRTWVVFETLFEILSTLFAVQSCRRALRTSLPFKNNQSFVRTLA